MPAIGAPLAFSVFSQLVKATLSIPRVRTNLSNIKIVNAAPERPGRAPSRSQALRQTSPHCARQSCLCEINNYRTNRIRCIILPMVLSRRCRHRSRCTACVYAVARCRRTRIEFVDIPTVRQTNLVRRRKKTTRDGSRIREGKKWQNRSGLNFQMAS